MQSNDPTIRIVEERLVYASRYGRLYDDAVEFLPQGTDGTYLRWQWNVPYSVAVLPLTATGAAILITSFRHAARRALHEAPKGFGSAEASPEASARKELQEELGLSAGTLRWIGTVDSDPAFASHPMHLFIAWDCIEVEPDHEESEVIVGRITIPLERTPSLLREGIVVDTVTLLMLWEAFSLRRPSNEPTGDVPDAGGHSSTKAA